MRFERLQPFGVVATEWALEDLSNPEQSARLVSEWHDAGGLLVLRGRLLEPEALVAVGRTFGEVENMVDTQMRPESIHEEVPEIFLVHNRNFSRAIPARPKDGDHVLQWPQRKGWHSDQSYRKPPPDASIIYCKRPGADGQGDTFFCDNAAAFDALSPAEQAEAAGRFIIHAAGSLGRSEQSVRKHPGVGAPPRTRQSRSDAATVPATACAATRNHISRNARNALSASSCACACDARTLMHARARAHVRARARARADELSALPLVVPTRIYGGEELGCSRWSFTRIYGGEKLGCSRWSFTRTE